MTDGARCRLLEDIAAALRSDGLISVENGDGQTASARFICREDGLYCALPGDVAERLRLHPSLEFASPDGRVSGHGRLLVLEELDREPELRTELTRAGIEVDTRSLGIRLVPHTFRLGGNTATFPFGGQPPSRTKLWFLAARPFSFTASLTPMLLGGVLAWYIPPPSGSVYWWLLPAVLLAGLLFHVGTNLVSDYYDFVKGVDRKGTMGGSGLLVAGLVAPRAVFRAGLGAFGIGVLLGLVMLLFRGLPLLVLGIVGLLGGFFYCGWPVHYKYRGLGELFVFALMGPLMVIGTHYVLTGMLSGDVFYISLPVGFLVAAILQSNNLRDIADDRESGITTLSMTVGQRIAALEYYAMLAAAYLSVLLMVILGLLPVWTLLVALTAPMAWKVVRKIRDARGRRTPELAPVDVMTAQVHMSFGLLLCAGIALGILL